MKKGINIWSFPQGTIKESLTLAKNAGFEGVELALNGEGELSLRSTEREIQDVRKQAEDLGLQLYSLSCGLCWDYRLSDDDPSMRQKAKDMIACIGNKVQFAIFKQLFFAVPNISARSRMYVIDTVNGGLFQKKLIPVWGRIVMPQKCKYDRLFHFYLSKRQKLTKIV